MQKGKSPLYPFPTPPLQDACFQYWPAAGHTARFGEYKVHTVAEEDLVGFATRKLTVQVDHKVSVELQ